MENEVLISFRFELIPFFFRSSHSRPLTYEYAQTNYHMGLEGYRYVLGEKTLGNNTKRRYPHEQAKYFEQTTTTEDFFDAEHSTETTDPPEQDPDVVNIGNCFCNGRCSPAGLMNVSSCRHGAPVFVSLPHFNRGEPSLRERITGLDEPNEEYDSYIILEPVSYPGFPPPLFFHPFIHSSNLPNFESSYISSIFKRLNTLFRFVPP